MKLNKLNRNIHKWLSITITIPFIVILVSGILLLVKKEVSYLQPATHKGSTSTPTISFDDILNSAKMVPQANIVDWSSIDRLDVRPSKGVIKIRTISNWEIQLDAASGKVLNVAFRRSDIIEKLHDGTYWQAKANLWFTLPVALSLLLISITGIVLFSISYVKRYQSRQKKGSSKPAIFNKVLI
jgi:uncharacterized iron-regulated membrane protein